jgi:uncharacterized heparinase superfamily protein
VSASRALRAGAQSPLPGRLVERLLAVLPGSRWDLSPAPPLRGVADLPPGPRRAPVLVGPARAHLLGRVVELSSPLDWVRPDTPRLVARHLHSFDDLGARGADGRDLWHDALIDRWVRENPPGLGPGWELQAVARRVMNWTRRAMSGRPLSPDAVHSLAVQARHLAQHVEGHRIPSDLLRGAAALAAVGVLFEGDEAAAWRARALGVLERELSVQVLPDGGHVERSPMVHALALEDLLHLIAIERAAFHGASPELARSGLIWICTAQRMRRWLSCMVHPDGGVAFFNDSCLGFAARESELDLYARRLGLGEVVRPTEGLTHLASTGYLRMDAGEAVLIVDVGDIGPRHRPGHGHADTLSEELSVGGRRLLVNSGTSLYERGPERLRQRSTAAHSTLLVDGEDSSEVRDAFRVGRRARPLDLVVEETGGRLHASCAHDGYRRRRGGALHRRSWTLEPGRLVVEDQVEGRFRVAEARTHLAPGVQLELVDGEHAGHGVLHARTGRDHAFRVEGARALASRSSWHPTFGRSLPNLVLRQVLTGPRTVLELDL